MVIIMDNNDLKLPQIAWINCRETYQNSREMGDVVVLGAIVREKTQMLGKVFGEIHHGSKVLVTEREGSFYKVLSNELNGWIQSFFVSWDWSTFTFFGKIRPHGACKNLDIKINEPSYELVIKDDNFALVTEGDPDHFDIIKKSVTSLLNHLLHAQALSTSIPLIADFTNWIETPATESKRSKSVGFISSEDDNVTTVSSPSIQNARPLANLVKYSPYFDLALSDFSQALRYPQHALIFLSRAIESLENSFEHLAKNQRTKLRTGHKG